MWDPYAEFQSAVLQNGLTVYAAHWPGRPWEAMGFLIHSGAEHDPVGLEGLSHFVEHLVSENAGISKKDMQTFFEDCGGSANFGTTGYPGTDYRFFVPADKAILAQAFSLFGRMLLSAALDKFIERERQIIIGEFRRHYPVKVKFDLDLHERKVLYAGSWPERFVQPLGDPESVARIGQSDLQSHYDRHYTPANMSIVGVGGMRAGELLELLSESPFAASKRGVRTPLPVPESVVAPLSETRYVFEISKYVTVPVGVGAYRSVAKIPGGVNRPVIHIMQEMLDETLNEEVRERRAWAYAIGSSRQNFRCFQEVSIDCSALVLEAITGIEEVVEAGIASLGSREDLFEQIKRRELASNRMTDPTGRGVCYGALNDLAEHQRIISLAEIGNDLEHATMNDVRNLLPWLRPERRWTLITRP